MFLYTYGRLLVAESANSIQPTEPRILRVETREEFLAYLRVHESFQVRVSLVRAPAQYSSLGFNRWLFVRASVFTKRGQKIILEPSDASDFVELDDFVSPKRLEIETKAKELAKFFREHGILPCYVYNERGHLIDAPK